MKSAAFEYARASSLDEVCDWLHKDGDDAKLIAGGQSLVPMMAMRLTRPARLININEIDALNAARISGKTDTQIRELVETLHTKRKDLMAAWGL